MEIPGRRWWCWDDLRSAGAVGAGDHQQSALDHLGGRRDNVKCALTEQHHFRVLMMDVTRNTSSRSRRVRGDKVRRCGQDRNLESGKTDHHVIAPSRCVEHRGQ